VTEYCKELAHRLPKGLDNIYLVNSGSEANDLAVNIARIYTGNHTILALRNSYHGMVGGSYSLTSLSTWKYSMPQAGGFEKVICPDMYKGPFG
jgi:alanine-glyoxylate transaminase / (R)-3-amino-2-methylpropionate-pyruvate transaminase